MFSCAICYDDEFFWRNENELTDQHGTFHFNHASAFYMSNNIVTDVDE